MRDVQQDIRKWLETGQPVALATVINTWGSAPRQSGSKLAITPPHIMSGSVSGGCVESAVIEEALASLADFTPRLLHFGVADDIAWDVGLACGGEIDVYVEPLDAELFYQLESLHSRDAHYALLTVVSGPSVGTKLLISQDGFGYAAGDADILDVLMTSAVGLMRRGSTERLSLDGLDVFVEVVHPRPHLIIVGGAHVAQPLSATAQMLGYRISLIDPRSAFATPQRFPDVPNIYHSYPDKALAEIGLDEHSCVVILSHDPKIDDPAVRAALASPAGYIGILSSRRTHARRIERLTALGIDSAQLTRIHTPIGLDIGAITPPEIAISIMAQIIAVRHGQQQTS